MEPLAIISDVHGNRWALAAVLQDIQQRDVTRLVNLGDCVYGPLAPAATARMLIERDIPTVCGNEDRLLTGDVAAHGDNPTLRMNREDLAPNHLRWLASLPATLTIDRELYLCHGTPHDDTGYLLRQVDETAVHLREPAQVAASLAGISARVFLCGHDHLPATMQLPNDTLVVNPGSVGLSAYTDDLPYPHAMAAGSPQARYCLLSRTSTGWDVEHHQVDYDWEAAASCAEKHDRPDWAHWLRTGTAVAGELYRLIRRSTDMGPNAQPYPICDLHCDLLVYLAEAPDADPARSNDIGCAIPHLEAGNVRLQVMAIYTATEAHSVESAVRQVAAFENLLQQHKRTFTPVGTSPELDTALTGQTTGVVMSIESASGICTEDGSLDQALKWLDQIIERAGPLLYISLTHAGENRFGGGNGSWVGLKDDGKVLLEYISGRQIAIDLSHTCDLLAGDIFEHIERCGLDLPVMASHSNFRAVYDHQRNLTDEFAIEIMRRGGLIGSNFLRDFLHPDKPEILTAHLEHGLELGGEKALCFGADYFHIDSHPDRSRLPFYFPAHQNAGCYQKILEGLEPNIGRPVCEQLASRNVCDFLHRIWG